MWAAPVAQRSAAVDLKTDALATLLGYGWRDGAAARNCGGLTLEGVDLQPHARRGRGLDPCGCKETYVLGKTRWRKGNSPATAQGHGMHP